MISIVIPTLNAEATLGATLAALIPAVVEGLAREVIIVDGGSSDRTLRVADASGATIIKSAPGRGQQLIAGAARARGPWLLFLHGDTILESGWEREAAAFMERIDTGLHPAAAAAFRFALDDIGVLPRFVEFGVALRCAVLRLPYGDQGLLIPLHLYNELGGFQPLPLMEDVEIIRRLGRGRTLLLRSRAITSAIRYKRDGYLNRVGRNLSCLVLYTLRVPLRLIVRIYG
jgi:rSAM/selenodomain-associated transferase 2